MSVRVATESPIPYGGSRFSTYNPSSKLRMKGLDYGTGSSYKSSTLGRPSRDSGSAGRYRSSSSSRSSGTSDLSSRYSTVTSTYGTIGRTARTLPTGPGGPFDSSGRKISTHDALSGVPRSPNKYSGNYGTSSTSSKLSQSRTNYASSRSSSLARDTHGTSSRVSEMRTKFERVELRDRDQDTSYRDTGTSSLLRSKRLGGSLYDVNRNYARTPDKFDKDRVDNYLDKGSTHSTPTKRYNASYTPRSNDNDRVLPDISHTSSLRSRSNSREQIRRDTNSPDRVSIKSYRQDSNSSLNASYRTSSNNAKADTRGLTGLRNLGNTCFMNSILQCLSNTKPLWDYIHKDYYKSDINKSTSSMKGALISEYASLMKSLWKEGESRFGEKYISPTSFKSQIQKFAPRFVGYNQQDAQEFLIYLLEGLHEDVNRVIVKKKRVIPNDEEDDKLSPSAKAKEYWKRYLGHDNSKMVDIFVGQLRSCLKCTVCGYESMAYDPFWDLSLPVQKIRSYKGHRLEECFQLFTQEEILDGDERPTCAKCKSRQRCTKRFLIQRFPTILVLHLKRFNQEKYIRSKLDTQVEFPVNNLDLSAYSAEPGASAIYNLCGVSNHSGSTSFGHYTAHCKNPFTGEWHYFNDQRVSSYNSTRSISSSEAYVLFYELVSHSARL